MVSELKFSYFSKITLDLTEFVRMSKSKIDLEFWQWVWKVKYIYLG